MRQDQSGGKIKLREDQNDQYICLYIATKEKCTTGHKNCATQEDWEVWEDFLCSNF